MNERKLKPVSVPFIVEWTKPQICGDFSKVKHGSYEFNAYGHDYSSLLSYALTRAHKATKRHGSTLINVQMKGDYDQTTDSIKLWNRKIVKFPELPVEL